LSGKPRFSEFPYPYRSPRARALSATLRFLLTSIPLFVFHVPSCTESAMAPNNLLRFFHGRYMVAITNFGTDRHDEALEELTALLLDPQLPMLYKLKANIALADGNAENDWHTAEAFRREAELVYSDIRADCPVGDTRWPAQERELTNLRESLDSLAQEQLEARPAEEPLLSELASATLDDEDITHGSHLSGASELAVLNSSEIGHAPNHPSSRSTLHDTSGAARAEDADVRRHKVPLRPVPGPPPSPSGAQRSEPTSPSPRRRLHDDGGSIARSPSQKRKGGRG
jgi:hypothetical protein